MRLSEPNLNIQVTLQLAVKTMNDIMTPAGLVASLLVFGVLPKLTAVNSQIPK